MHRSHSKKKKEEERNHRCRKFKNCHKNGNERFKERKFFILFNKYSPTFLKCIEQSSSQLSKNRSHSKKRRKESWREKYHFSKYLSFSIISSHRLDLELSSRLAPEIIPVARGKMWMEGREQRDDGEEHTHAQRRRMHL